MNVPRVVDESPEIERMRAEGYARMTPRQKLEQMLALRQAAWVLKRAGLKQLHPEWSEVELERAVREIFLYATT